MTALLWLLFCTGSALLLLTVLGVLVFAHRECQTGSTSCEG